MKTFAIICLLLSEGPGNLDILLKQISEWQPPAPYKGEDIKLDEPASYVPPWWESKLGGHSGPRWSCLAAPIVNHRPRLAVMAAHEIERKIAEELNIPLPHFPLKPHIHNYGKHTYLLDHEGQRPEIWIAEDTPRDQFYFELEQFIRKIIESRLKRE